MPFLIGSNLKNKKTMLSSSAVERTTVNRLVAGSIPAWAVSIRGDCTWSEQFGYIWLCVREIIKMQILGDKYHPDV